MRSRGARHALIGALFGSLCLLAPGASRADLPRPEGWEPSCTIEKHRKEGEECKACRGYRAPDPCQEELAKGGYARRCEEGGAGSYVAVWCKGGAGAAPSAPAPTTPATPAPDTKSAPSAPAPPPASDNKSGGGGCTVEQIDGIGGFDAGLAVLFAVGLAVASRRFGSGRRR